MAINIINKRKQQEEQGQTQQGSTAPVFSGPSPGSAMQQPQAQQKGSGFTNIQRIAQANQPGRLGQAVGQGIQNIARSTQQQLGQAQQQFQQQAQANRLGTEQDVARRQEVLQRISSGNEEVVPTQDEVSLFEKYRRGQYTGPQGLQSAENLQRQAQQAEALAGATRSAGGRQALLQRFVGTPQYTQGQQRLDTTLLGLAAPQELSNARRSALGLVGQVQGNEDAAQAQASYLAQQARDFGQATEQDLLGRAETITTDAEQLRKQREEEEVNRRNRFDQIRQDLYKGQISREDAQAIGGQDFVDFIEGGSYLYSASPQDLINKYLQTEMGDRLPENISDVISKEQAARFNALSQLAGQDPRFDLANVGQFKDSTQAFDFAKLQDQITQDRARIEEEYKKRLAGSRLSYGNLQGNMNLADYLDNLTQVGAMGAGQIATLSPEMIGRYIANSNEYRSSGRPDIAGSAIPQIDNVTNLLSRADQLATAEYQANPELRKQFPNMMDFIGRKRIELLRTDPLVNVGGRLAPWMTTNSDVLNRYMGDAPPDQVERELASERGGKLRFKETR